MQMRPFFPRRCCLHGFALFRRIHILLPALLIVICVRRIHAQAPPEDPIVLVRAASWNELHSSNHQHPFRFRLRKQDETGVTTKDIVETKDGDIARLVAVNDQPLTPDRAKAERTRLDNLLAHPELQTRRHKKEQEDSNRSNEMVRLLPDAFIYTYQDIVQGPSGPAWRFTFSPNDKFIPPDREAQVYHGMAGELWIDCREKRLARLDAHLISDVNFGWGVIGRLYKGGTILVKQEDVGENHWENIQLKLNLTGKILMLHSVTFQTTEDSTGFKPVSNTLTYQDAIRMLESEGE